MLSPQYFLLTYKVKCHLDVPDRMFGLLPPEAEDLTGRPTLGICVLRRRLQKNQEGLRETPLLTVL